MDDVTYERILGCLLQRPLVSPVSILHSVVSELLI